MTDGLDMKGDLEGKQLQKSPLPVHQGAALHPWKSLLRDRKRRPHESLLPFLIVLMFLTCCSSPEARYESASFLVDLQMLGASWGCSCLLVLSSQ